MAQVPPRPRPLMVDGIDRKAAVEMSARSPRTAHPASANVKVRLTLEAAWNQAEKDFIAKTGRSLMGSAPAQKKSVIDMWQQKYERESSDKSTQRYNQMVEVLSSVVNGLEVVGAFAAQAASMAFPPAGMCFNAIAFLIDAPRQIKNVYDTLKALFDEVNDFLVKFKIYRRIDNSMGLDPDLIENTNRVLICFVRICALSIKLLEGSRFLTAAKVVFLKDDSGVSDEMKNMQELSRRQDQLAGTVTLEHVMKSEADVKQILAQSGETNSLMRSWVAANNDERNKMVNQERLRKIERSLFSKKDPLTESADELPAPQEDLLPETIGILEAEPLFKRWLEPEKPGRAALFLQGASGTGKTRLYEALREKLDSNRQEAGREEALDYVAYHTFTDTRSLVSEKSKMNESSIPYALRSMALQVAHQSTSYAKILERQVQDQKNIKTLDAVEEMWSALKLFSFSAPPESTLFLLFDGIDLELEGKIADLLDALISTRKQNHAHDIVKIRILLTGIKMLPIRFQGVIPTLHMDNFNTELVKAYIEKELRRLQLLQDVDKKTTARKRDVLGTLPDLAQGSFEFVRSKIDRLHQAIENDSPSNTLMDIINTTDNIGYSKENQKILNDLQKSLSTQHVQQLNNLLMWLIYRQSPYLLRISELEAALYLHQGNDTLESLSKKCRDKFSKILARVGGSDCIRLDYDIEDMLKAAEDDSHGAPEATSLISMDITIKNARESDVRKFFWDLNEQISSGKFDFSKLKNQQKAKKIYVNKAEAHSTITRLCLTLVNSEKHEQTEPLLNYALDSLPRHLTELVPLYEKVSNADKKLIMQGLINFLSDPYYLEHELEFTGLGDYWLKENEYIDGVRFWLLEATNNPDLQPRERRWVSQVVGSQTNKYDHMKQVVLAIARRWVVIRTINEEVLFSWLDKYLDLTEEAQLSNIVPEQTNGEGEQSLNIKDDENKEVTDTNSSATLGEDQKVEEPAKKDTPDSVNGNPGETEQAAKEVPTNEIPLASGDTIASNETHVNDEVITNGTTGVDERSNSDGDTITKVESATANDIGTSRTKLTVEQRVLRAAEWIKENLNVAPTFKYLMNLGYTCYDLDDYDAALKYFEQAKEYPDEDHWRVFIAIGRVYWTRKDYAEAAIQYERALEGLRPLQKANKLTDADVIFFVDSLRDLADIYHQLQRTEQGIPLYEEALSVAPSNVNCRFKLLEVLCKTDQTQHATELLGDWSERAENYGGKRPSDAIYASLTEESENLTLTELIRVISDEKVAADSLRTLIINVLSEAIITAKQNSRDDIHVALLCLKASASATKKDFAHQQRAVDMWEEALGMVVPEEFKSYEYVSFISLAARCASGSKFDEARANLLSDTSIAQDGKDKLRADLIDYITYTGNANTDNDNRTGIRGPEKYLASFCFILGETAMGRGYLEWDMRTATEVLCDDDDTNDGFGITKLVDVLMCVGDKVGALTAWSLLDRQGRADKLQSEKFYDDASNVWCEGCDTYQRSSIDPVWYCRFCPSVYFCQACHTKMQQGNLRSVLCNPNHEFWCFYHTKYEEEEVAPHKVRIGWDFEDKGDGKFERKGGRIVELREWLNGLRQDWGLEDVDSEPHGDVTPR